MWRGGMETGNVLLLGVEVELDTSKKTRQTRLLEIGRTNKNENRWRRQTDDRKL